ncbi:hypothetical protein Tel_12570 [Candidatus Tenderia electrophaga]|uniref:Bacterial bifunctional deaminase-reductase C-terminal domain-containing protein n=1 Tax=Candidatus Tenderia electrophaga TaxID=1748243 RepID=A0A0S2TFH4_9GAMM|nr:hypothetical protein Tel_12570 [Candidatus Tenderia electrophaga]
MTTPTVTRLAPSYEAEVPLEGLYLQHALHRSELQQRPLVYSNFIASLDGRIAVAHPETGEIGVPDAITNRRDWRLYQELAAQADILVSSARYVRDLSAGKAQDSLPVSDDPAYDDLRAWRRQQGMAPQPAVVILSASLNLPIQALCEKLDRPVYVATGAQADAGRVRDIEACGARVLRVGEGKGVDGEMLVTALAAEGFCSIYSVAGPGVLETLLKAGAVNRLYLTQVHRLLGGASYDTLLEGGYLRPPADFTLKALYYDRGLTKGCGQFFSVYDAAGLERGC